MSGLSHTLQLEARREPERAEYVLTHSDGEQVSVGHMQVWRSERPAPGWYMRLRVSRFGLPVEELEILPVASVKDALELAGKLVQGRGLGES